MKLEKLNQRTIGILMEHDVDYDEFDEEVTKQPGGGSH